MLKLLNTKLLIAILAVLSALGSAAIYQHHEATKAAATLEQQQRDAEKWKRTRSGITPPPAMKVRP